VLRLKVDCSSRSPELHREPLEVAMTEPDQSNSPVLPPRSGPEITLHVYVVQEDGTRVEIGVTEVTGSTSVSAVQTIGYPPCACPRHRAP
jgi:hypothetical protein